MPQTEDCDPMSTQKFHLGDPIQREQSSDTDLQLLEHRHDASDLADAAGAQHMERASSIEPEDAHSEVDTESCTTEDLPQLDKDILALPMDHDGNAQAVVLRYGESLLYCSAYQWLR